MLQPGDSVCERFVIEKLVGAGATGEVYRCRDSKVNNRLVAVKVLRSRRLQDAHVRDRIASEVRALSELNHPHICTTHELCSHQHRPAIVMEFLYGTSLAKLTTALEEGDARRFGAQIADALACAHARGVVHRDIRPAHIIVTPQGVKLIDFALVSLGARDSHKDAAASGTSFYMSPEQLAGKNLDCRTDIYSFGLVLCQMYTGFAPDPDSGIARRTLIAGAIQQVSSQPVRMIIDRCVRDDRDERWATASDLSGALQAISETVTTGSSQLVEDKPSRRRWIVVGTLLMAALLGLGWCSHERDKLN